MKKFTLGIIMALALILSACASPTPPPTLTAVPTPTTANTPTPANTPTAANTATPAPTATPAATATPVCPAAEANNLRVMPLFTSNSKHIVLGTGCGVEVFEAQTLKPVANYGGLVLANVLPDGRFAARAGSNVVLVEPASGKMESLKTKVDFSGIVAVSPAGTLLAKLMDGKTVRLFDLNSDKTTDLALQVQTTEAARYLRFSPNGALLVVGFVDAPNPRMLATEAVNFLAVYEVASAKKLYETGFSGSPRFSPDSKYLFPTNTFVGRNLYDATTGKSISSFGATLQNCAQGGNCGTTADGGRIVEDRYDIVDYFIAGGPETVIVFWEHTITSVPPGVVITQENFSTAYKNVRTQETYIEDFVANKRKFAFATGGLTAEDFAYGAGTSDGSVFLLVRKAGGFTLYSGKDGKALASLDRFALK
ncbi:MAG: WD40 repeat domain-containing protein [Chloroflexi bacterium]|nr:WD40 repeat domain-containing protein [Chloroflexota bacterium]